MAGRHADAATGAIGGAPHGATQPLRGAPTYLLGKHVVGKHAGAATGAFGGISHEATKRVRGDG
eukprot:973227-Pyramimonas_sp.AAC.1